MHDQTVFPNIITDYRIGQVLRVYILAPDQPTYNSMTVVEGRVTDVSDLGIQLDLGYETDHIFGFVYLEWPSVHEARVLVESR